jgi:hypothetical protein
MSREVERQSERYAQSPHLRFRDVDRGGDHAYNIEPKGHDLSDEEYAQHELAGTDEESGYNWGPPPSEHEIHDPGFHEAETDPYPYE